MSLFKKHPHLKRCHLCREMMLSTDDRCPHCGAPAEGVATFRMLYWFFKRLVVPVLLLAAAVGFLLLAIFFTEKQRIHRAESERALREGAFP